MPIAPPPPAAPVAGGAESRIVTSAIELPTVAPPVGLLTISWKVSSASARPSSMIGMNMDLAAPSPLAHRSVPLTAVKSTSAVAVMATVA